MKTVSSILTKQWEALYSELSSSRDGRPALAGLFLGWKPDGFDTQAKRLLLVGKATAGEFKGEGIHEQSFGGNSAFWRFALEMSHSAGAQNDELVNVAWSNVSKIGTVDGNPPDSLQLAQAALACRTLRQEIDDCKPTLVVFVCDGYCDDVVYDAVNAERGGLNDFETRQSAHGEFYVRTEVRDGPKHLPPMLWLRHPQGKLSARLKEWTEEPERLMA